MPCFFFLFYEYRYLHQNVHFRRKSRPKRFSRDQGFYEAEDDDDTSSIASVPLRPRHSRQHAHRRVRACVEIA